MEVHLARPCRSERIGFQIGTTLFQQWHQSGAHRHLEEQEEEECAFGRCSTVKPRFLVGDAPCVVFISVFHQFHCITIISCRTSSESRAQTYGRAQSQPNRLCPGKKASFEREGDLIIIVQLKQTSVWRWRTTWSAALSSLCTLSVMEETIILRDILGCFVKYAF